MPSSNRPPLPAKNWAGRFVYRPLIGENILTDLASLRNHPDHLWFSPNSPIHVVHHGPATYSGSIAALLVSLTHPATHNLSALVTKDPWAAFRELWRNLVVMPYNSTSATEASQPRLAVNNEFQRWQWATTIWCVLNAHQQLSENPLSPFDADEYVAQTAAAAIGSGINEPAQTVDQLYTEVHAGVAQCAASPETRKIAHTLLKKPPIPLWGKPHFSLLVAGSVAVTPEIVRRELQLPLPQESAARLALPAGRLGSRMLRQTKRRGTPTPPPAHST